ncbi:MAG: HigA family addiction module antidote protein [Spirochaetaceae bacterium]|jgi:addiction module HigA family antidote|nr:HigA family addiction module antidote protein [Spirochaetaceae bacterium]
MNIPTILPGEILAEEFMRPNGLSTYRVAKDTGLTATAISQIIKGKRRITIDTALRLSAYFGNSIEFWIGIQNEYDIRKEKILLQSQLHEIHPFKTSKSKLRRQAVYA